MNRKNYINILLILIWLFVIFSFSAEDSKESLNSSDQVIITTAETIKREELTPKEKESLIERYIVPVRKSAHFFLYFVLGFLVYTLIKDICGLTPASIIFTMIFCIVYACSDEIHQIFVPGRTAQVFDVFVDSCGSLLSTFIVYIFCKIKEKRMIKLK